MGPYEVAVLKIEQNTFTDIRGQLQSARILYVILRRAFHSHLHVDMIINIAPYIPKIRNRSREMCQPVVAQG